jgi:hypothetical protein
MDKPSSGVSCILVVLRFAGSPDTAWAFTSIKGRATVRGNLLDVEDQQRFLACRINSPGSDALALEQALGQACQVGTLVPASGSKQQYRAPVGPVLVRISHLWHVTLPA